MLFRFFVLLRIVDTGLPSRFSLGCPGKSQSVMPVWTGPQVEFIILILKSESSLYLMRILVGDSEIYGSDVHV